MDFNVPSKTIRVASLNFLNNPTFFEKRLETLIPILESIKPDVILMQEILKDKQNILVESLSKLGYVDHLFGSTDHNKDSGNAVFSKIRLDKTASINFEHISDQVEKPSSYIPAAIVELEYEGCQISLISTHFTWGFQNEASRVLQAEAISRYTEAKKTQDPERIIILGGDLNASEHSATVQFLKGRGLSPSLYSTYWVDAWELHGNEGNWSTTDPRLFWNKKTALSVGSLNPDFTPERRIDYLFSYGWCYGKIGYPYNFGRFGDTYTYDESEISDHYGIFADFVVKY